MGGTLGLVVLLMEVLRRSRIGSGCFAFCLSVVWPGEGARDDCKTLGKPVFLIVGHGDVRARFSLLSGALSCLPEYQAVAFKMASSSLFQIPHCGGLSVENRPASCGHTLADRGWPRPRGPRQPCGSGLWRSYEWHDPAGGWQLAVVSPTGPGRLGRLLAREVGRGCCTMPASLLPGRPRTTAQPIVSVIRRGAASLWVYAALLSAW